MKAESENILAQNGADVFRAIAVVDSTRAPVWLTGASGDIAFVNQAFADLTGMIVTQELGELAEAQGALEAAQTRFEDSLALYQLRSDQNDGHVANLKERVGRTAFLLGDLVRAREIFSETNMIWREQAGTSRFRAFFSAGLVRNLLMLGEIAASQHDQAEARLKFEEALAIAQARAEMRFRDGTLGSDQPQISRDLMVASARMYQVTGTRVFAREARSIARRLRGNGLLSEEDAALIATLE